MKRNLIFLCQILITFILLQCNGNDNAKIEDIEDKQSAFTVKTLLATPQDYVDKEIAVVGMVYAIKKDKKGFLLVDLSECSASCEPTSCKVMTLPIQSDSSAIPKVGEKVIVMGVISKNDGRFSFALQKVEPYHES